MNLKEICIVSSCFGAFLIAVCASGDAMQASDDSLEARVARLRKEFKLIVKDKSRPPSVLVQAKNRYYIELGQIVRQEWDRHQSLSLTEIKLLIDVAREINQNDAGVRFARLLVIRDPDDQENWRLMALSLINDNRPQAAADLLDECPVIVRNSESLINIHGLLSSRFHAKGDYEAACQHLSTFLTYNVKLLATRPELAVPLIRCVEIYLDPLLKTDVRTQVNELIEDLSMQIQSIDVKHLATNDTDAAKAFSIVNSHRWIRVELSRRVDSGLAQSQCLHWLDELSIDLASPRAESIPPDQLTTVLGMIAGYSRTWDQATINQLSKRLQVTLDSPSPPGPMDSLKAQFLVPFSDFLNQLGQCKQQIGTQIDIEEMVAWSNDSRQHAGKAGCLFVSPELAPGQLANLQRADRVAFAKQSLSIVLVKPEPQTDSKSLEALEKLQERISELLPRCRVGVLRNRVVKPFGASLGPFPVMIVIDSNSTVSDSLVLYSPFNAAEYWKLFPMH